MFQIKSHCYLSTAYLIQCLENECLLHNKESGLECEINMSIRPRLILQPDSYKTSTQGVSWQTQHIYSLFWKKNHSPNPLLTPPQRSFLTEWLYCQEHFFFFPSLIRSIKKPQNVQTAKAAPFYQADPVCHLCLRVWRENQKQNVNDAWKPLPRLPARQPRDGLRLMCFASASVCWCAQPSSGLGRSGNIFTGRGDYPDSRWISRRAFSGGFGSRRPGESRQRPGVGCRGRICNACSD